MSSVVKRQIKAFDDSNLLILIIALDGLLTQQPGQDGLMLFLVSLSFVIFGVHYWRLPWTGSFDYKLVAILLAGREQ